MRLLVDWLDDGDKLPLPVDSEPLDRDIPGWGLWSLNPNPTSRAEANYGPREEGRRCGECAHFLGAVGLCHLVAGEGIVASHGCDLWTPLGALVADAIRCPPGSPGGGQFTGPDAANCDTGLATTDAQDLTERDKNDIARLALKTGGAALLGAVGFGGLVGAILWLVGRDDGTGDEGDSGRISRATPVLRDAAQAEADRLASEGSRRELRSALRSTPRDFELRPPSRTAREQPSGGGGGGGGGSGKSKQDEGQSDVIEGQSPLPGEMPDLQTELADQYSTGWEAIAAGLSEDERVIAMDLAADFGQRTGISAAIDIVSLSANAGEYVTVIAQNGVPYMSVALDSEAIEQAISANPQWADLDRGLQIEHAAAWVLGHGLVHGAIANELGIDLTTEEGQNSVLARAEEVAGTLSPGLLEEWQNSDNPDFLDWYLDAWASWFVTGETDDPEAPDPADEFRAWLDAAGQPNPQGVQEDNLRTPTTAPQHSPQDILPDGSFPRIGT